MAMDYVYLLAAVLAGVHAVSYGLWEKGQGNKAGAFLVFALALLCVILPIRKLLVGP